MVKTTTDDLSPLKDALATVMQRLGRSLALYTVQIRPWVPYRREELWELLEEIASQHREWADRLADKLTELGGVAELGPFPASYARFHDLSIDFLAVRILEEMRQIVGLLERLNASLTSPEVRTLLEEIREGLAKQVHTLEEALIRDKILAAPAPQPAQESKSL